MGALIGLDLGTSSAKALVIDAAGEVLGSGAQAYAIDSPRPGWAEQDPRTWEHSAAAAVRQAVREAGVPPDQIMAIGLSGQMHSLVCLDQRDAPVRPAILWADQRSAAAAADEALQALAAEHTRNPLPAGFLAASWQWLRQHEPEQAAQTRTVLLPKDALRLAWTGERATDFSDASATGLFDPAALAWSPAMLEAVALPAALLPPVRPSAAVGGRLRPAAAEALSLRAGTPVVLGASDQAAQAVGNGILRPGQISSTIGTGGQIFAPLAAPTPDPQRRLHLFCHAAPGLWHAEAAVLSAGLGLRWLRDALLGDVDFQALADEAEAVEPGCEGLLFAPYLAGERTPYLDTDLRGGFLGLTLRHGRVHLVRAVMEGAVLALRQGLALINALLVAEGVEIAGPVVASGGGSRHRLWLRLQADIFRRPVIRSATREAAAFGAALLAGVGAGLYPDLASACKGTVRQLPGETLPDSERASRYDAIYRRFTRLAGAIRSVEE